MTRAYETDKDWYAVALPLLQSEAAKGLIPDPPAHDVAARRHNTGLLIELLFPPLPLPVPVQTTKHGFPSFDGATLDLYEVRPAGQSTATPGPAVLYVHGGGMICMDAVRTLSPVQAMAAESGVPFFSVEYRTAPENPHPGLVEDVYHALLWLRAPARAAALGVDPARIAVAGDSAGGGIAAGVALLARDRRLAPPLAKQILLYPMLDHRTLSADPALRPLLTWTPTDNVTGWSALLGRDVAHESVDDVPGLLYASPARAASLAGLPDAYLDVGALDLFHDEICAYAARLRTENAPRAVELHVFPGLPHAFNGVGRDTPTVKRALELRNAALQSF